MKVAVVTPYYQPHPGGVEVYVANMVRRLQALGWDVCVITTSKRTTKTIVKTMNGVRVYRLGYQFKFSNTPISLGWRHEIERILRHERPDVINAHTPVPYLADVVERVRGKIPFVLTYHNDVVKEQFPYNLFARLAHFFFIASTLRRANRIIVTSAHYIETSSYLRTHKAKISVVPPGVDTDIFHPRVDGSAIRKRYGNKPLILFVGSIETSQDYKGLSDLIACLPAVKAVVSDVLLLVVGKGNGAARYKQLAQKLGLKDDVRFVGHKTQYELAQYNAAAGVQVLPSTNKTEGFGMVLIEAGACGTPVVGTRVGGIPSAIEDGVSGLLVPPRNRSALAGAICAILTNRTLAKRLGRGGIARTDSLFGWDKLAEQTSQVLAMATKPTIVHVAGYFPPHVGGMETVAKTVADKVAGHNYDTRVLTSNIPTGTPLLTGQPNPHITRFASFEFAHTPVALGFIPAIFRIPRHAVVHLHLAQAFYPEFVWLASKLCGTPYIVHFHLDLMPSGPLGRLFLVYKATILRLVIRGASRVVVFSSDQQRFIRDKYGVADGRIAVIPNGVDGSFFAPPRINYAKRRPVRLLYVGRLSAQKCVDRLIGMMPFLKTPAHLTVVGDGDMRPTLEKQVKALGLTNVSFEGYKSATELCDYFADADIFVIASEREGMPLVVLEAMAAALPIVGSNVTGIRELVGGVGMLVDDPSAQTFAKTIDSLAAEPSRLAAMSKRSTEAARAYTWARTANDFETVYAEVAP